MISNIVLCALCFVLCALCFVLCVRLVCRFCRDTSKIRMQLFDVMNIASPVIYWALMKFVTAFVKPSPDSPLFQKFRSFHNICMIGCSALVMMLSMPPMLNKMDFSQPVGTTLDDLACKPVTQDIWAWRIGIVFNLTRWWEWCDSICLIAAGKKLSSLHWNHHASIALLSYTATRRILTPNGRALPDSFTMDGIISWLNGTYSVSHVAAVFWIPAFQNSVVHLLMYCHFLYPRGFLHPYRKIITQMQIFQHITVVMSIIYVNYQQLAYSRCMDQNFFHITGWLMYFIFLYQFTTFYMRSYNKKKPKAA